jgi:hypothetical protein
VCDGDGDERRRMCKRVGATCIVCVQLVAAVAYVHVGC